MAIKAAAGLVEEWYTPVDEVGEDVPTRFKLRPLNQMDLLEVMSEGRVSDAGEFYPNHKGRTILLRKGLVDWEEFNDPDNDRPIKFTSTNFHRVPAATLGELANEIMVRSVLTEDEKKS